VLTHPRTGRPVIAFAGATTPQALRLP